MLLTPKKLISMCLLQTLFKAGQFQPYISHNLSAHAATRQTRRRGAHRRATGG